MNLANLPKYKLIMCDPQKYSNCDGMYKADDGNIVKFEEAMEASSNSLQQLKAKIAAKKKHESPYQSDYEQGCVSGYNDAIDDILRQLSAV